MENQKSDSNKSEDQNITYSISSHQGSKWKTGLSRLKNNISKPVLLSPPAQNHENETNQKAVVVNFQENNAADLPSQNCPKIQVKLDQNLLHSKKHVYKSSISNHSNQSRKLFLPSSLFNNNLGFSNNDLLSNDNKVHFNSEVSLNNSDLYSLKNHNSINDDKKTILPQLQTRNKYSNLSIEDTSQYNKEKSHILNNNQFNSKSAAYKAAHKSFDAHFQRKKEALEAFKKRDWLVSERLYKLRSQKVHQLMNWKEFNPEAKVTFFTDNYITEEVHEEVERERKINDLPDRSSVIYKKFKLPPDRQMASYKRDRVYFWG